MKLDTLIIFFLNFTVALGWGAIGHSLVVRLAQSRARDYTSFWLSTMLPVESNGDLSEFASWADNIIYSNTNPGDYVNWQWTRPFHYINVPDWNCSYDKTRDCSDDICVAAAIQNYTERLRKIEDLTERKRALYFLIHYVGDIHQPLHTGFTGDRGGNSIVGFFRGSRFSTNLHSLWDTGMISYRLQSRFSSNATNYFEFLRSQMSNLSDEFANDENLENWINENLKLVCDGIYINENNETMKAGTNFTLGNTYFNRNIGIVEQRLILAGARLGHILNEIANDC